MEGTDLDGGGLAGAIGAQQAKALLAVDSQGEACHRHLRSIPILALVHLQQAHMHHPTAVLSQVPFPSKQKSVVFIQWFLVNFGSLFEFSQQ